MAEHVLPKVSFIIPVLNAAGILENCLQSIARQSYPRERIEILVVDGGSKDGSQDLARKYGAVVIDDQVSRHMEDSKKVALSVAGGDFIVFVDSDNEITHPDYVEQAVKALAAHPDALGVEGYYPASPKMTSFCAYVTQLLHISDPLCWLMSAKPVFIGRDGDVERWKLPEGTYSYPLGANGFVYRKADLDSVNAREKFQDTHMAMYLMQAGKREWLRIRGRGVHHYYAKDLWSFLLKRRRAMVHFLNVRREFGGVWLEEKPPVPGWLACLYCVSFVGPLYHTVRGLLRDGDPRWLWHTPASLASVLGAIWGWITHRRYARETRLVSKLQPKQTLKP
jgi:glycosyltransferase involved in cell wall biosynthesis